MPRSLDSNKSGLTQTHPLTGSEALGEEGRLHEVAEPPAAHHCATLTDAACVEPVDTASDETAHGTSVSLDVHTSRSKTPTDHLSKEHSGPAALPDVTSPEYHGPDLFARLSPEIREMIYELVYADANIFAGVQGFCSCSLEGHDGPHKVYRTESAVLLRCVPGSVKGTRGTRLRHRCYLNPCDPEISGLSYGPTELEAESTVLSPANSLLFVNKQTYLEALPHLYRNTTFFFDDSDDTDKFVEIVGNHCLKHIGAIEVFMDEYRDGLSDDDFFSFIVASMPNIEHLTVSFWYDHGIRLETDYENGSASRCDELEKALLRFSSLKRLRQIDVKILIDDMNYWGFAGHVETEEAAEEMIRTGDQRVLDRARVAILREKGRNIRVSDFEYYAPPGEGGHTDLSGLSGVISHSGLSEEWWLKKLNEM